MVRRRTESVIERNDHIVVQILVIIQRKKTKFI